MLLHCTVNPQGEGDEHNGVLLRERDIDSLASSGAMLNKPVKIEHVGSPIGHVVSAWKHDGKLDCVLRIDNNSIDSIFAQEFIKSRRCPEVSLSYSVSMEHSETGVKGGVKEVLEVSLVKKGAR